MPVRNEDNAPTSTNVKLGTTGTAAAGLTLAAETPKTVRMCCSPRAKEPLVVLSIRCVPEPMAVKPTGSTMLFQTPAMINAHHVYGN